MAQQQAVRAALEKEYPLPRLNPDWVATCISEITAVEAQNGEALVQAVRECYLDSNLATSTLPSTTLPTATTHNTYHFPTATLLQIESITEIGTSAFQLQTTLDQRRDVFQGVGRIKRMPDPTEQDDQVDQDEENGEGDYEKLPPYPRGMLRFVVGDGRVRCTAIEFKRIQGFKLGETALGCKIQVQNVKVLHGMLLLMPTNTRVLYHSIPELQATQAKRFVASLRERMGKEPLSDDEDGTPPPPPHEARQPQLQTDEARAARRRAILGQAATVAAEEEEDDDSPPKLLSRFFAVRGQPQPQAQPAPTLQDSDAFSDFDVDEGILAQIDAVERGTRPVTNDSRGDVKRRKPSPEIIEISSD